VLRVEAAYFIRAAIYPPFNRHSFLEAMHLPMETYSQLLSEASHVQPIWCPLSYTAYLICFAFLVFKPEGLSHPLPGLKAPVSSQLEPKRPEGADTPVFILFAHQECP
jgi:hypothetical protein